MEIKCGIYLLKMKKRTKRFKGFAHRIFQLGAVMGCAVNPPRKTIKIPTIAEKRNIIKEIILSSGIFLVVQSKEMTSSVLMLNINNGDKYQGVVNSCWGAL